MIARSGLLALGLSLGVAGCGDPTTADPRAERGRQVYLAQCTQCHAFDPAQSGAVGPPIKAASKALLEAKVLHGDYPPGYAPKRPTKVMPPMPALAPDIDGLAAYLR